MIYSRFESIGAYLPSQVISTGDLLNRMSYKPPFNLEDITGIKNRRVCSEGEDSFTLALDAAQDCLRRSRIPVDTLGVIISTSVSRIKDKKNYYWDPSFSLLLAQRLGASSAIHFDLSNACAGMFSGVYMLDQMIKAGIVKNGMVVSGEYITPIADTAVNEIKDASDPQFASLTVGDGGAAVILDRSIYECDRLHSIELVTSADYSHLCIGKSSDQEGGPALYTNNREMHKEDRLLLWPKFQSDFMTKTGSEFSKEKYDYVIHHQVGTRFIKNISKYGRQAFQTEMPESLETVSDYANTASTAHFLTLYQHLKNKRIQKGSKILMVPAASGIVAGFLSTTISSLEI